MGAAAKLIREAREARAARKAARWAEQLEHMPHTERLKQFIDAVKTGEVEGFVFSNGIYDIEVGN